MNENIGGGMNPWLGSVGIGYGGNTQEQSASARMAPDRALQLFLASNSWAWAHKDDACYCGACYVCAYHSLKEALEAK